MDFGSLRFPTNGQSKIDLNTLTRWNSDGSSSLSKHVSCKSQSSFLIQGDPLRHEIVVQARGQRIYYLRTEKKLIGKRLALHEGSSNNPVYYVNSHKAFGYMEIARSTSTSRFRFAYPRPGDGMYAFNAEDTRFVWDYRQDTYLKCYDTTDMSIVAELFWKDATSNRSSYSSFSCKSIDDIHYARYVAKMVMAQYNEYSATKQMLIALTGLLILRNSIWRKFD